MTDETNEVRLPRFARSIAVTRTEGREAPFEPRRQSIGALPPFDGLLDLSVGPGDRTLPTLSYLVLRPLPGGEPLSGTGARIARPEWTDSDQIDGDRIPKGGAEERTIEPVSAESAFPFLTLRPPVLKGVSGRSSGGASDRTGPVERRTGVGPTGARTEPDQGWEVEGAPTSGVDGAHGREAALAGAAEGPARRHRDSPDEGRQRGGRPGIDGAGSRLSFLTLRSLAVQDLPESASRRVGGQSGVPGPETTGPRETKVDRDREVASRRQSDSPEGPNQELSPLGTTGGRAGERDTSIGTIDEGFPQDRTTGIDGTERPRSDIAGWTPPSLGRRDTASGEGPRTSMHVMTVLKRPNTGEGSPAPDADPAEAAADLRRSPTQWPGGEGPTPPIGRNRDGPTDGRPDAARRDDPTELAGSETPTTAPGTPTDFGEGLELTVRRAGATDGRDGTGRVAGASGGFDGVDLSRGGQRGQGSRDRRGNIPSSAPSSSASSPDSSSSAPSSSTSLSSAPSPEQVVDVDRLVNRLYRGLERKMRIERERRGL